MKRILIDEDCLLSISETDFKEKERILLLLMETSED